MSIVGGAQGGDLVGMLSLLSNQEVLQARLTQYETARKEAEAKVALVGPAEDILRLRDEAQKLKEQAEATLANADIKAKRVVAEAKREADEIKRSAEAQLAYAKEVQDAAEAEAARIRAGAEQVLESAKAAQKAAEEAGAEADQRNLKLEEAIASNKLLRETYEAQIAKLKDAQSKIGDLLKG